LCRRETSRIFRVKFSASNAIDSWSDAGRYHDGIDRSRKLINTPNHQRTRDDEQNRRDREVRAERHLALKECAEAPEDKREHYPCDCDEHRDEEGKERDLPPKRCSDSGLQMDITKPHRFTSEPE
jgi:hypothetical protein